MTVSLDKNLDPKALAEVLKANSDEEVILSSRGNNIRIWLDKSGGYITLNWSATEIGKYDYVALYDHSPNGDAYSYLTNQWQWTVNHTSPHTTGTWADGKAYWIAYCAWGNGNYFVQAQDGPFFL